MRAAAAGITLRRARKEVEGMGATVPSRDMPAPAMTMAEDSVAATDRPAFRVAFGLVELCSLLRHEETLPGHLAELTDEIARDGELRCPIVVDRRSLVILDGHHRARALENLGCTLAPVYLVDYLDPGICVVARRPDIPVTKEAVVRTGLSGIPYPPKTSRHVLPGDLPPRATRLALLRP